MMLSFVLNIDNEYFLYLHSDILQYLLSVPSKNVELSITLGWLAVLLYILKLRGLIIGLTEICWASCHLPQVKAEI
jgi:hypothetical protein